MQLNYKFITKQSEVDSLLPRLMAKPSWGYDVETTGKDPHVDKTIMMQFGRPEEQFVLDVRKVNPEPLLPFFSSEEVKKIAHFGIFDYMMTKGTFGIDVEGIRCTWIGEKVLNAGRKFSGYGLAAVMKERLGIELSKTEQTSFIGHQGEFSTNQIEYGARDTAYLIPLSQSITRDCQKDGVDRTFVLECEAMPAFGDMMLYGFLLDKTKWKKIETDNVEAQEAVRKQLDEIARPFWGENLFGEVDINYGSPAQVLKLLQTMHVKIREWDRVTKKESEILINKTDDKSFKKVAGKYPVIGLLQDWRSYSVLVNTFGQPYIDAIHPKTGRLHHSLDQLGAETGRITKGRDCPVNLLNIPRENRFRNAFVSCNEDYVIETDDYSGCEMRILAEESMDPILLDIFRKGEDPHCAVASQLYRVPVTKKNENAALRTPAKSLNFGIAYGMGPMKLHDDLNAAGFPVTRQEAINLYDNYCRTLHVAVGYLRSSGKLASSQGYLVNLNGRRRYWFRPDLSNTEKFPGGTWDPAYKGQMAAIEREGGNFMISSVNADMTKYAMTNIRKYIKKNRVRSKLFNQVYDEILTETHKDDSPSFHEAKLKIMREAGEQWLKNVPVEVDGHVGPYWTKE